MTAAEAVNAATTRTLSLVPMPAVEQHRGQLRMAERFVRQHAEALRHVHGIGWHKWTGARWEQDDQAVHTDAAIKTIKAAVRQLEILTGQDRDDLYKDIRKSESASGIAGITTLAAAMSPISVSHKQLDADPYLFNTTGGTVNLETGEITENNRDDLITKVAAAPIGPPAEPAEGAEADEWTAFVERILPDPEIRAFVQRLFGYAMLGKVTEHVMPIFTGTGANGKGTMRDAIAHAFGDYAIEVDPSLLMESKHEQHGTFKMRLRGARLAFCSETEKGRRFAEATMKRLVGGDEIVANLMHKNPIQFAPSHTLVMLTNHLPAVSGDDPAIWRRILVVPFDVVIPEKERDGNLPERLREAADVVLWWVWQGWLDYRNQGLNPPAAVRARTEDYKLASDVLGRFMEECVTVNQHASIKARDLFSAWSTWCLHNREECGSEVEFAKSMGQRGYEKKRSSAGQMYRGLMLTPAEKDEDDAREATRSEQMGF